MYANEREKLAWSSVTVSCTPGVFHINRRTNFFLFKKIYISALKMQHVPLCVAVSSASSEVFLKWIVMSHGLIEACFLMIRNRSLQCAVWFQNGVWSEFRAHAKSERQMLKNPTEIRMHVRKCAVVKKEAVHTRLCRLEFCKPWAFNNSHAHGGQNACQTGNRPKARKFRQEISSYDRKCTQKSDVLQEK